VEEPSKPHSSIGMSAIAPAKSGMILVFERSNGVGDVPSIQMYSA
jgi:hypothetical protein